MFQLLSKNFALIAIIATTMNAVILWVKASPMIKENEELKEGYLRSSLIYATLMNIPWVIMLAGILSGSVSGVFGYFAIREGNIYVSAFLGSIALINLAFPIWVFVKGGAKFLVKHPGAYGMNFKSEKGAKLVASLFIPFMIVWFVGLWHLNGVPS